MIAEFEPFEVDATEGSLVGPILGQWSCLNITNSSIKSWKHLVNQNQIGCCRFNEELIKYAVGYDSLIENLIQDAEQFLNDPALTITQKACVSQGNGGPGNQ